jgi:hypothetical protein
MAVPTARKSCTYPPYGPCGRCGRYFARFLRQDERRCLVRGSATSTTGPQSRLKRLRSRRIGAWGRGAPTRYSKPSTQLLRASSPGERASQERPGVEHPATPLPAGFFPPLLREGVAAERISTLGDETTLLSALFPMHSEAQQQLWLSRVFLLLATHSTKDPNPISQNWSHRWDAPGLATLYAWRRCTTRWS